MAEKVLGATKISTKNQVTVPVEARKRFKMAVGNLLLFIEKDGELVIRKG